MKVVLLRDVPKIGRKYEVKEVSDGYVRNFLLPRKLAEIATEAKVTALNAVKEKSEEAQKKSEQLLKEAVVALNEQTFTLHAKADDHGHLFKKIRAEDILKIVNEKSSVPLETGMIELEAPLTTLGSHEISTHAVGVTSKVFVVIEKEK